jgi:uncharacterized protein DUF1329|tara:strand:+ start:314 stop:583 length:270 start_codon:yes stop_codon:yes gene_type:complete
MRSHFVAGVALVFLGYSGQALSKVTAAEAHNISYYSEPVFWTTMEMTYDLKAERYYIDGLDDGFPAYDFDPGFRGNEFTASAARRAARR